MQNKFRNPVKKVKDDVRKAMDIGEKDEDIYTDEGREKLEDDDEIDAEEEGFMEGAEGDGARAKCAFCGQPLFREKTFETKIKGKVFWFCSEEHIDEYKKKKKLP